ncbi:glycosyltransferase family 4 protein, partial [Candidatus Bathyarchaeota archaeon]|nr:glycosyltransferase family 4 protein [Candidatus Bathyarchaeota archaeon]
LEVVPFFSPVYGGSAISPYLVSKELAKRGHEVTVVTSDSNLSREWVKSSPGLEVLPFRTLMNVKELYVTPGMSWRLEEKVRKSDIVHMHNFRTYQNIVARRYARKNDVPYVLQAHGSLPKIMEKSRLKWAYDRAFGYPLLRDAAKVIALVPTEAEQYRDMGVNDDKIAIIPNGIDLNEYSDLPSRGSFKERFSIDLDERIVLFLGRISEIKQIDVLVRAFKTTIDVVKGVKLVIVGPDGGYMEKLMALVKDLDLEDQVVVTGPLYDREKLAAYVDSFVYVLPSRYETFPMTILEAYACSKPVIASNVNSIPDLVRNNRTGLLVTSSQVGELASALSFMLSNSSEAEKMGLEGRKTVEEEFSIAKVVDRFEGLFKEVSCEQ